MDVIFYRQSLTLQILSTDNFSSEDWIVYSALKNGHKNWQAAINKIEPVHPERWQSDSFTADTADSPAAKALIGYLLICSLTSRLAKMRDGNYGLVNLWSCTSYLWGEH